MERRLTLLLVVVVLVIVGLLPLAAMCGKSIVIDGRLTLAVYAKLFANGRQHWPPFGHSLLLATLTAGCVTLLGVPFGLVMGYWFAWMLAFFLDQEVFRFPFVIANSTYGLAAATVLAASIGSALLVRRKLDDLDLIAVLKARE